MDGIPIIRIEVEGMKERIGQALMIHSDEFNEMVKKAIDKSFNVETIQHKIDMQVAKALDDSIQSLSGDLLIQDALKCFVLNSIVKMNEEQMKS